MRKPKNLISPMAKPVFIAAVVCTLLVAVILTAGIVLYNIPKYYDISVTVLTAATVFLLLPVPLLWIAYYTMTHLSVEEAEKILNAPPKAEFITAKKVPKRRFNFTEDTVRENFGRIAEKYKLRKFIDVFNYEILPFGYDCTPKKGYNIKLYDHSNQNYIFSVYIRPHFMCFASHAIKYSFDFYDDFYRTNELNFHDEDDEDDYVYFSFLSEITLDTLSDKEIFDIIEKMIDIFYGVTSMSYESKELSLYRKYYTPYEYTFYLDAPDYYGYTETTEIGNFKFILNKENGGN